MCVRVCVVAVVCQIATIYTQSRVKANAEVIIVAITQIVKNVQGWETTKELLLSRAVASLSDTGGALCIVRGASCQQHEN